MSLAGKLFCQHATWGDRSYHARKSHLWPGNVAQFIDYWPKHKDMGSIPSMIIIIALRKWKQEDQRFKVILYNRVSLRPAWAL